MSETLAWPPRKEDLERLYVVQHLSAMKIANVYGLSYASPKTAESTVLYHLKRNGIRRRDAATHVRKVTQEMVDDWVRRYEAGESLKQIAGTEVSPVTVFLHLRKRGIKLRDKVEAQIQAVTKHERKPFSGDDFERAYLIGLRYGDLDVAMHGRAVRVRISTTHPAMADLFDSLFTRYGFVHRYPRPAKWTGFEWNLETDLDPSHGFLLKTKGSPSVLTNEISFVGFLSGFFDAEGTIYLHKKRKLHVPELFLRNTRLDILEELRRGLAHFGISCVIRRRLQKPGRGGIESQGIIWSLEIWRLEDVRRLLGILRLRHKEKVAKSELALRFIQSRESEYGRTTLEDWNRLIRQIKHDRDMFVLSASIAYQS